MKQSILLLCLCALAVSTAAWEAEPFGRTLLQDTGLLCSAERQCLDKACTAAYAENAAKFPYTLDYTTSGDENTTTFVFNLCSEKCTQGEDFCHPLSNFQLRLANQYINDTKFIQKLPSGSITQNCAPRGPGLLFNRTELKSLGKKNPANDQTCEQFTISVFKPRGSQQLKLKDLCQQDVTLVNKNGVVLHEQQQEGGDSCLYILQTSDKTSGFAYLKQKVPAPPPAPGRSPSVNITSVSPPPTPSPSPVASPSPQVPPPSSPPAFSPPVLPSPSPVFPPPSPSPVFPPPSPTAASPSPVLPSPSPLGPSPSPNPYSPQPYSPSPSPYSPSPNKPPSSPPPYYSPPQPYTASPERQPPLEMPRYGRRLFG